MAGPECVHDRIASFSSEIGGTVGVAARNRASQASVCVSAGIATELHAHLGEPA